jgi:hypothetical protein
MTPPFDARPLTEPVDRGAVTAFAKELRARGAVPRSRAATWIVLVVVGVIVLFMLSAIGTVFGAMVSMISSTSSGYAFSGLVVLVPFLVVVALAGALIWWAVLSTRRAKERWFRLDRFARSNGMRFLPAIPNPPLPGMIFGIGDSRRTEDVVRGEQPRFVEFANHRYATGSGKNRTTHQWGYVAIKLDVPLPHIVLDALSNNGLFGASNLPAAFDTDQRLSLEGDFDRYFALYCPAGYERDALYLFTPDIMARFIDNAAALDVEIVDDWLFLYTKRPVSTLDPASWAWLFSVVAALLDKLAQWARWRDDHLAAEAAAAAAALHPSVAPGAIAGAAPQAPASALPFQAPPGVLTPPPPGVARAGQRLKRRVPWVAIVICGVFVLGWFVLNSGILSLLFR